MAKRVQTADRLTTVPREEPGALVAKTSTATLVDPTVPAAPSINLTKALLVAASSETLCPLPSTKIVNVGVSPGPR